jgi:hypothetical protein
MLFRSRSRTRWSVSVRGAVFASFLGVCAAERTGDTTQNDKVATQSVPKFTHRTLPDCLPPASWVPWDSVGSIVNREPADAQLSLPSSRHDAGGFDKSVHAHSISASKYGCGLADTLRAACPDDSERHVQPAQATPSFGRKRHRVEYRHDSPLGPGKDQGLVALDDALYGGFVR